MGKMDPATNTELRVPRGGDTQIAGIRSKKDAAREFEALLIGKLLETAFAAGEIGFGVGDNGGDTMLSFGREHLARVIAQAGGLGLARQLELGLGADGNEEKPAPAERTP